MLSTYIKHLAVLTALTLQSTFMYAGNDDPEPNSQPVELSKKSAPIVDGYMKPSKSPSGYSIPVRLYLDMSVDRLYFENPLGCQISYFIYNEDESLVIQDSFMDNIHYVNLNALLPGQYTIDVVCNGEIYEGTFEL